MAFTFRKMNFLLEKVPRGFEIPYYGCGENVDLRPAAPHNFLMDGGGVGANSMESRYHRISTIKRVPVVVICNKFQCIPSMLYVFRNCALSIKMAFPSEKTAFSEKMAFSMRKKCTFPLQKNRLFP